MSELPGRPDLDQLRRQARELLRAATNGEPRSVARVRAVSERVTLSAAQLAVAREYGYRSWPALKAEVERRRLPGPMASPRMPGGEEQGVPRERWSFGGATALQIAAGVLVPETLVAGAGQAMMYASLMPSGKSQSSAARPRRLPALRTPFARWARRRRADAAVATMRALARLDDVTIVDDRGAGYSLRPEAMSGHHGPSGALAGPMVVRLKLDPVPGREVGWLELRSQDGAATRLLPSPRPGVRIGQPRPTAMSPAERELLDQALRLIGLQLTDAGEAADDILGQRCSAALAMTAQIQRSGELDSASQLPHQLRQLCAVLTGDRSPGLLPAGWSGMLGAARRADGLRRHLDIGVALPPIDGVAVQIDSLISRPGSWQLYLRAAPGWGNYSEDGRRRWSPVTIHAEDDRGGTYLHIFGGSTAHHGYEELTLQFLPRLDPLAHALTLTFRGTGQETPVDLLLESAASSQRE